MAKIEIDIKNCTECPHFSRERQWTEDSWEEAYNWYCGFNDKKRKIASYVECNDNIDVPEWCTILIEGKLNETEKIDYREYETKNVENLNIVSQEYFVDENDLPDGEFILEAGHYVYPIQDKIYEDYTDLIGPVRVIGLAKMYGDDRDTVIHEGTYVIYESVALKTKCIIALSEWDEIMENNIPSKKHFNEITK